MDNIQDRWRQHQQQQQERRGAERSSLPPLQTQDAPPENRFSFTATPAIAQQSTFEPVETRPHTMIDEDPMSPETVHQAVSPMPSDMLTLRHETLGAVSPLSSAPSPYPEDRKASPGPNAGPLYHQQQAPPPPQEIHPAHFAPYADQTPPTTHHSHPQNVPTDHHQTQQQQQQQQQPTNVLSPQTFSDPRTPPPMMYPPMPQSPHYPSTDQKKPSSSAPANFDHPDQNPYSHPAVPSSPLTPAYTPTSPLGPNASAFHLGHRPGQIEHPLAAESRSWHAGTLSPSGTCVGAVLCPCVAYGKVQHRLEQRSKKGEATNLLGYGAVNGDCGLFALACGLCGLLPTIQRKRVRRAYAIDGDIGGDCIRGCCCCGCTVALNEREIVYREEERKKRAGQAAAGYSRMATMTYPG